MRNAAPDSTIQALLDERDQLLVQISLEADAAKPDPDRLFGLRHRLTRVEKDIAGRRQAVK